MFWRQKTHKAINNQFIERLNIVAKGLYEVELVKSTIEHRETIKVGFLILQYAKLRMLELYNNFFDEFCDVNKFEELEMITDSLYLVLAEKDLDNCILPSKRVEWTKKRSKDCRVDFRLDAKNNFFPRTCCSKQNRHDKREPRLFKEEFRCSKKLCLCSKT